MKTETTNKANSALLREVATNITDLNNVLTTAGVKNVFQGHNINNGITGLITEILTDNGAQFPAGIEATNLRKIAIGSAMFASEILAEVESRFSAGSTRYPSATVHQYLSVFMAKQGTIGKIRLSNAEDKTRPCCKPRIKFYLVTKAA